MKVGRSHRIHTFTLLLPFISAKVRKPVDRLDVEDVAASRVRQFLVHLEQDRGCSVQTRNQRLTAIRSFARFVAGGADSGDDGSGATSTGRKDGAPSPSPAGR